jgi:hypothetical protein
MVCLDARHANALRILGVASTENGAAESKVLTLSWPPRTLH